MSEDLQREYEMRFFAKNVRYRARVWSVLTRKFFACWILPDATVLDLGCGWGEFINQVAAARRYGMDLNPETRSKLNPEVTLLAQNCSERWALHDGQLDLVFTSNFFEHLPTKESPPPPSPFSSKVWTLFLRPASGSLSARRICGGRITATPTFITSSPSSPRRPIFSR